ncbi:MAG: crossover junction endodeoxyribonuclease RuvC [Pseudomonadota bacterium]
MRSLTILGVDPGLRHTGWGVISRRGNQLSLRAFGVISPPTDQDIADRLFYLVKELETILSQWQPDLAALEETFVNVNGKTTLQLGFVRGALLVTMARFGVRVRDFAPRMVKKSLTGSGAAQKAQVAGMVGVLLGTPPPQSPDACDALAVAICGSHEATHQATHETASLS